MDKNPILEALNIRYVDLCFVIEFPVECFLPRHKASALRGGMGQMLMEQFCISNRNCEHCQFATECPVQHMMYARYEIQPRFGGRGESMGYIIECENHKEHFDSGESMEFHLLLFGKTIVWFSQFLQAFYMLGHRGLGKNKAQFWILKVLNEQGDCVMLDNQVWLDKLGISTARLYAEKRLRELQERGCRNELQFTSPVSLKYHGELLEEFQAEALIRSIFRRVYSFDCFEGNARELMRWDQRLPQIVSQHVNRQSVSRYSEAKNEKMSLRGIIGNVKFDDLPEELLLLFAAGEKLHIGNNTSFGFGKYILK